VTDNDESRSDQTAGEPVAVRLRGIYTTALTQLLGEAGHEVVQASPAIQRRFDQEFERAPFEVTCETGPDRQGVALHGEPEAVATLREELLVAVDTMAWTDPVPLGAVAHGRVTETLGGGAVVDLGVDAPGGHDATGYLPYSETDDRIETGDNCVVQVTRATAPWDDDRPELTTQLRARGGLGDLVRGQSETRVRGGDEAAARELAGMTELLDLEPPDGWGIEWNRDAPEAGLDALRAALERAERRAAAIETAVTEPPAAPATLLTPSATAWVWFGRDSRFTLDGHRRAVTSTMPGHHRTKAASAAASSGVDLAEALCSFDEDPEDGEDGESSEDRFPFTVVTDQFGPTAGDRIEIAHGKPDGRLVSLGRGEVTSREADGTVTVERSMTAGGTYDALGVPREAGDTAVTTFREGRWWYPTVYRSADGQRKGTYVNICTPAEVFPDAVRYVDLHVDVVRHRDGMVERVDDGELDDAVAAGNLRAETADRARAVATAVERALRD
jgi:Ribonuclease G/E